jgi:molybdopterin biosynthesis enzyme
MLGAHLFLGPLVEALGGAAPAPATSARATLAGEVAAFVQASPPDFLTLPLVHLAGGRATPVLKDSMSVTGASQANGYFAVPPGAPAPRVGDPVDVIMFG